MQPGLQLETSCPLAQAASVTFPMQQIGFGSMQFASLVQLRTVLQPHSPPVQLLDVGVSAEVQHFWLDNTQAWLGQRIRFV
ncbi:MAG: hypothetical protein JOZ69_04270, partial [Myxococcales bacterium]|nr:hypothetical protein [Myxococcales bacterium]